ncbi:MAG: hypothetical protein LBG44_01415 [Gemmatimonadota bacterium]|jgi:hypothetical protein|nr:hypothetical protein [Gemmatimonadota bacterium]
MSSGITVLVALVLAFLTPGTGSAQEWRPGTRQMPQMPELSELSGDWLSPRAVWFNGVAAASGVSPEDLRAVGEPRRGTRITQVVRFNSGPVPVVVWQDRNADGVADIIEILRSGGVVFQLIDADYDGQANVLRSYNSSGKLTNETRF